MGQVEIIRSRCLKLDEEILKIEEKVEKLQQKKKEFLEKRKSYEAEIHQLKVQEEIERNKKIVGIIQDAFGEITEERLTSFREAIKEVADIQAGQNTDNKDTISFCDKDILETFNSQIDEFQSEN